MTRPARCRRSRGRACARGSATPRARQAIEFSIALGQVICVADPGEAAARDAAMAATVMPGLSEIPDLPGIDAGLIYPEHDTACAPRRDLRHKPRGQLWDGNAVAEMRH